MRTCTLYYALKMLEYLSNKSDDARAHDINIFTVGELLEKGALPRGRTYISDVQESHPS